HEDGAAGPVAPFVAPGALVGFGLGGAAGGFGAVAGGPGGGQVCGEALQVGEGGGGEGPFDAALVFGGVERPLAPRVAEALDGGVAVVVGGACPVVCVGHDRFPWAVPGSRVARCGGGVRPSG